jgi:chorismate mutase
MARKKLYRTEEEIKERNRKKSRKSYWKNKQITDIDKILNQWASRSQSGKPNFSMSSLNILDSVLIDFNWSKNERLTLIKQIGESKMNSSKLTNENKMIIEPIPYQQKSEPKIFSCKGSKNFMGF